MGDEFSARQSASSLTRMLSVLDLFTIEQPLWSTLEILEALGTSRSTGYRYIKELASAGLLSAVGNGHYILGPRIIELDLQIRTTDPLLQASQGSLEQLFDQSGHSALLCTLFQDSVLCVREMRKKADSLLLINRGQRRPLLRGAMSKAILAYLPTHQLRSIFNKREPEIVEANLGEDWEQFKRALMEIRGEGFAQSKGEYTEGVFGVGAPIFNNENAVVASVGVAWKARAAPNKELKRVAALVMQAAEDISAKMAHSKVGQTLSPRAVR